jgi:hypothetical protein
VARTGRFGRQPRQAQSLTNTLVAIAREFQNQRAQNIMDAWQKGGTFEGKKATDSVVLAFWKDKMSGVSKDDPLYDTYKNAHSQLDYSIAESKMTAGYATKKYSDGQMVSFYLNWAKKVPKDSEFYRVLQRDAGQYMRTQQATSRASSDQLRELRYQKAQAGTQKQMEAGGEYVIDTLRRIAQSGYVNGGIASVISGPGSGSDLTDFDPNDPDVMLRLIAAITTRENPGAETKKRVGPDGVVTGDKGEFIGNPDTLYHDDDGRPVTGTDIMRVLGNRVPGLTEGQPFTINLVTDILDTQMAGLNERIARAKKTGHMTDVASLTKSKGYVATLKRQAAAYPVQRAYEEARADYDAVVGDKSSSPAAVLKAWDEYSATLTSLSNDPRIAADDATRTRLIAERDGTTGVPTLHETFTGLGNADFDAASAKDSAENAANIQFLRDQTEAVATSEGAIVWTYGELDSNGIFQPKSGGTRIGAATIDAVKGGGANMQAITIDDPRGGVPITMMVTGTPIYAVAKHPETGDPLSSSNSNPIGWAYDIPKGDTFETQYGIQTKAGLVFSADPPYDPSLPTTNSGKGGPHIEVDLSAYVARSLGYDGLDPVTGQYATKPALDTDVDLPGGIHVVEAGIWNARTRTVKPGTIVFDPQDAAQSTDTRNGIGTPDPISDFTSLTLSNLMMSYDGRAILSNLDKYPEFKQTIDRDVYTYAGYQQDVKTGAWVPGTNADPNKLAEAMGQRDMVVNAKTFTDFVSTAASTWQRTVTGSPFLGGDKKTGNSGVGFTAEGFAKLATDLVQGTPFEALGDVFKPGTATIKPAELAPASSPLQIKPVSVIKAPAVPTVNVSTGFTTGPVASQTGSQPPAQTGSQAPAQTGSQPPRTGTTGGGNIGRIRL